MATLVALFILLAIMFRGANPELNPCGDVLVATRNDTIDSIAARCGISQSMIYELNPRLLSSNIDVQAGMILALSEGADIDDAAEAIFPDFRTRTP